MKMMTPPCKYKKVLVIGAGPDVVGQSAELNGALWQVCRALRAAAIKVVLIDSNLSAVATDLKTVARTYIEPLTVTNVEQIIAREKPDAVLPIGGGRGAVNLLADLTGRNVLEKYHVKILGPDPAQSAAADRLVELRETLTTDGLVINPGAVVRNPQEGLDLVLKLGLPVALRPVAASAGAGSALVYNREEFGAALGRALEFSPVKQVLIETALEDWREYELLVLRDATGRGTAVAALEYFGPMSVHAGDRMKITPPPGLTPGEAQWLAETALKGMAHLQLVGGANWRFARNPATRQWVLTNLTLRYTTVSALLALASGCPVIQCWTKLLLGSSLIELFGPAGWRFGPAGEMAPDYWGVALPGFAGNAEAGAPPIRLGMAMRSVGEAFGIGGCVKEAFQKAAAVYSEWDELPGGGFGPDAVTLTGLDLKAKLVNPDPLFLYYAALALRTGMVAAEVAQLSKLAPWLLVELEELLRLGRELTTYALYNLPAAMLRQAKAWGFSDRHLARLFLTDEAQVRAIRHRCGILPEYRAIRVVTAATAPTVWFSTYATDQAPRPELFSGILLVGGGLRRIGAGTELDYAQVHALNGLAAPDRRLALLDSNPYAVALGSPRCERVYLEPVNTETVFNLNQDLTMTVVVDFAGATGERLTAELAAAGVRLCGNRMEVNGWLRDAKRLGAVLTQAGIGRADSETVVAASRGLVVETIGDGETAVITGIVEQIEEARINLNDSACSLPPYSLAPAVLEEAGAAALRLNRILKVRGLLLVRFAVHRGRLLFLEAQPGPGWLTTLICKATGRPWIETTARVLLGTALLEEDRTGPVIPNFTAVKEVVFPFNRFPADDPALSGTVRSYGAALGMAQDFGMAFIKSQLAAGGPMPFAGVVYLQIGPEGRRAFAPIGKQLIELGFELAAPEETVAVLRDDGLKCQAVKRPGFGRPDILDWIKNGKIHWLIGAPAPDRDWREEVLARQAAVARGIPITTTLAGALAAVRGMRQYLATGPVAKALQDYTFFAAINHQEAE
jgi:carbamoyl-phosphate synthase large subunit